MSRRFQFSRIALVGLVSIGVQFIYGIALALSIGTSIDVPSYYGAKFQAEYRSGNLRDQALLQNLQQILANGHIKKAGQFDEIVPNCNSSLIAKPLADKDGKCVQHKAIGYDSARKQLFGRLYLEQIGGVFTVKDVYCERTYSDSDFGGAPNVGPGLVPDNSSIINTEHTWPQSRFTSRFPKGMQKSDLHHLFPTDSEMNARRGSLRFGNVKTEVEKLKCPIAKLGQQDSGDIIFEVPEAHKGHVARAIFYFATRYQMKIASSEENTLRQWHRDHPVDEAEFARNAAIEMLQGNRNPYVDLPDLLERIQSFNTMNTSSYYQQ